MLFVLSPAKALDYDTPVPTDLPHTLPVFGPRAAELVGVLREKSPEQVAGLMRLSDALAGLNVARYAAWRPRHTARNARQAVLAFDGELPRGPRCWRDVCALLAALGICARTGRTLRPVPGHQHAKRGPKGSA